MHRFLYRGENLKKTSNHQPSLSGTLFCSTFKARDPGNKDGNHRDLAQRELRNQTLDVFVWGIWVSFNFARARKFLQLHACQMLVLAKINTLLACSQILAKTILYPEMTRKVF